MITSMQWIPCGAARARPVRFELTQEDYDRVKSLAAKEKADAKAEDEEEYQGNGIVEEQEDEHEDVDISDLPPELKMEDYDEDEVDDDYDNDSEDAFDVMTDGNAAYALEADSEDEDAEDDEIRATDKLLAAAVTEDEYSHLEIHLLTEDGSLYVHHDITLPEFPLCLAWLDCPPHRSDANDQNTVGNFMAVGSFDPAIEIWNLDVLDPLEPTATLGKALRVPCMP
jgi:periodic tryptophan protein 1